MHCSQAGQMMQSTGLCTMGCALPLATGYSHAASNAPVVAVMGDGCLDMVMGELATLRDVDAPVVVVVFVDGSYSLIAQKQRSEGYQAAGVDFGATDYAAIAKAIGLPAWTVSDAGGVKDAVAEALNLSKPALVAVTLPRGAYQGKI